MLLQLCKDQGKELSVCIIEKGREVGERAFSAVTHNPMWVYVTVPHSPGCKHCQDLIALPSLGLATTVTLPDCAALLACATARCAHPVWQCV